MILIGSKALEYYLPLNRKTHDWDLLMNGLELDLFNINNKKYLVKETPYSYIYDINGEIVEVKGPEQLDQTDIELLANYANEFSHEYVETPYGICSIPNIQTIFDIKKATALLINEPKHRYDLDMIERRFFKLNNNTEFFQKRFKEIETRIKKSSKIEYDFFHKYHIPEYIKHDRMHDMFADLLDLNMPTYKRITVAETDIAEELFNKLTHEQKISLMVEEVLVLNLERWFNPQMVENGINYRLIEKFYNNNEAMPTYLILKHVCLTGLKGEAKFITDFSKENFFEIEKEWIKAKEKIKEKKGFPIWFFDELFKLRQDFKDGKQVGVV